MTTQVMSFLIILTFLNLILIIINRSLWLQIIMIGLTVAEVGTMLIYQNAEILGLAIFIVYNGALLILFTLSFLLITPARVRVPKTHKATWSTILVMVLAAFITGNEGNVVPINYKNWSSILMDDALLALNVAMFDRFNFEFLGLILLLFVGIASSIKILKN